MRCISKNALSKFLEANRIYLLKKNMILVKQLRTKSTKITPCNSVNKNHIHLLHQTQILDLTFWLSIFILFPQRTNAMSGFIIITCDETMYLRLNKIQNTYTAIFCCTEFPFQEMDKMVLVNLHESRMTPHNIKSDTQKYAC